VLILDQTGGINEVAAANCIQEVWNRDGGRQQLGGIGRTSNSGSWPPCTTRVETPLRRFSRGFIS
jgi:hypothetical protein